MVNCLRYSTDEKKNGRQKTCGSADKKIIGYNAWLYECENKHEKIKFIINLHAVCAQMARSDIFMTWKKPKDDAPTVGWKECQIKTFHD